eukprot:scaffold9698_cov35-Phaeocystis_antarctica.AAC.1
MLLILKSRPTPDRPIQPRCGSTLFAGLAQLPTRVQKVAAWRVGWRRSQGRDSRRARTVTSIPRRSKKHSLGFFWDSPIRGTMVYLH